MKLYVYRTFANQVLFIYLHCNSCAAIWALAARNNFMLVGTDNYYYNE